MRNTLNITASVAQPHAAAHRALELETTLHEVIAITQRSEDQRVKEGGAVQASAKNYSYILDRIYFLIYSVHYLCTPSLGRYPGVISVHGPRLVSRYV